MSLVKLDKMDQPKARHKKNHPVEKGHGVGTTIENVIEFFLPANVPFMFERGQTFWIYLHLQIAGPNTSTMVPSSWALRSDLKFSFTFSSLSICNNV